jgi:DNA-binding transcriptional LysR family regulator
LPREDGAGSDVAEFATRRAGDAQQSGNFAAHSPDKSGLSCSRWVSVPPPGLGLRRVSAAFDTRGGDQITSFCIAVVDQAASRVSSAQALQAVVALARGGAWLAHLAVEPEKFPKIVCNVIHPAFDSTVEGSRSPRRGAP